MATLSEMIARLGQYLLCVHRGQAGRYRYARTVKRNLKLSVEAVHADRIVHLRRTIENAYTHSPFYRARFQAVGFEPGDLKDPADLRRLPELTKMDLRNHINEMVGDNVNPHEVERSVSGGTTGLPVSFLRDKFCVDYRRGIDLALSRYYGWCDGQWQGLLWGAAHEVVYRQGFKARFTQLWADRVFALDCTRLSDATYEEFVTRARKYRPSFVLAYPSLAYDLAERIEAGRVSPVRVPVINVTAEPLYDFQRRKIESVLAERVYARYGAREFGTVAFECPQRAGLHIIPQSVYIEIIPLEGQSQSGVVLVTDLLNRAMPLIRYRIGDLARLDESPCECGLTSPRLLEIQVRETDIIWRPDGTGLPGTEIVTIVGEVGLQARVQIVQEKLDEVVIRLEGDTTIPDAAVQNLLDEFHRVIGAGIRLRVQRVNEIERARSGKYRYVISHVSRPEGTV